MFRRVCACACVHVCGGRRRLTQCQCHGELSEVANQRDGLQNQSSSVFLPQNTNTLTRCLCFLNTAKYMGFLIHGDRGNDIPLPNPIPLPEVTSVSTLRWPHRLALACSHTDASPCFPHTSVWNNMGFCVGGAFCLAYCSERVLLFVTFLYLRKLSYLSHLDLVPSFKVPRSGPL